jgi:hypothetical protein
MTSKLCYLHVRHRKSTAGRRSYTFSGQDHLKERVSPMGLGVEPLTYLYNQDRCENIMLTAKSCSRVDPCSRDLHDAASAAPL